MDPFATAGQLITATRRPTLTQAEAQLALARASGAIRNYCHWTISREVLTEQPVSVRRRYCGVFFLPTLHLVSIEALEEGDHVLDPDLFEYAFDDFGMVTKGGGGFWSTWPRVITISYTHGYADTDPEMDAVRDICLRIATRLVDNPSGHASETTGSESWSAGGEVAASLSDADRTDLGPLVLERP